MSTKTTVHEDGIKEVEHALLLFRNTFARSIAKIVVEETVPVLTGALKESIHVVFEPEAARVVAGEPVGPRPAPSNYALWVEIGSQGRAANPYLRRGLLLAAGRISTVPV